jgi:hypothetical protein
LSLGLLTTCGLTYFGIPSYENGEELGLHGRIGNIPAEEVGVKTDLKAEKPNIAIWGKICQEKFFGENIVLRRKIKSYLFENKILINDSISNEGFQRQPLMLLYHINFGYPLLQESSELIVPIKQIEPRDENSKKGLANHLIIEQPQNGFKEQVFYLDLITNNDGFTYVGILNGKLGFGVYEKFKKKQLPRFIQWKQMGEGYYVMGLEPSTNYFEGRTKEREKGRLKYIEVGEVMNFELEIGILNGKKEIKEFKMLVESMI